MATENISQQNDLEEVIRSMRAEREREKAAKESLDESLKAQSDLTKANVDAAKKIADANLTQAEADAIAAKSKISDSNEKAKISAQEIKNEKKKLNQESSRRKIDEDNVTALHSEVESYKEKIKRLAKEEKEFGELAEKMGKIREMIKSPFERLYDFATDKSGFDIKKRPVSTAIGVAGLAANTIVNQDKVPPIFGILVKAITGGLIFTAGIMEKNTEKLINKIRGHDHGADELIKIDPVLREIAAINKKLALELATERISKFKRDVIEEGIKEKELLIKERSDTFQRDSSESIIKNVKESINEVKQSEPVVHIKEDGNLFTENKDHTIISKLDDLILTIKNLSNQFDPETDTERYNEEVVWRKEVLEKLDNFRTNEGIKEKKSAFGFLEGGAFASIATFVSGIIASVGKFLLPLSLLSKGLLKFVSPLAFAASIVLTMDWKKDLINPLEKIKSTFTDGNYLEALFRSISLPVDIITKFVGRSLASISGIFGFDDLEKELNVMADKVNFVDMITKLKDNLFKYINDITIGIDFNFSSLTDRFVTNINNIKDLVNNFNITDSIKDLFNFISDKIESLKFWKNDKTFKTPEFIQRLIPERLKQNLEILKSPNENSISNNKTIEKIENNINKLDTTKSINQLSKTHEKLIEKQSTTENNKLEKITERLGNITTNVVNQQVNNSNVTSISQRPRPRIEDIYSRSNHGSDFSGYQLI